MVRKKRTTSDTLDEALAIMTKEIAKMKKLQAKNKKAVMDDKEARVLTSFVDSLLKTRKDEREIAKNEALQELTDTELNELASKALDYLGKGND